MKQRGSGGDSESDGGTEPLWNPKGGELFYRSGDKMMAVPVQTQDTFSVGRPQMLFQGRYLTKVFPQLATAYDVAPDGQRFLMIKESEEDTSGTINVVLNWFEELKQRVPTGTK